MKLYDYLESGNGYKVRLLLAQLGLAVERVELDIVAGATRTDEYLAMNPNGRIPLLELDDGSYLAESNAIQFYLASGTPFLPSDKKRIAEVLQWMFFEQYSHEPYIAVVRFWAHVGQLEEKGTEVAERMLRGYAALAVMDRHLADRDFFVDDSYTIADIALYAYTHVAEEGGYQLSDYPNVVAWLERVRAQPRHIPITLAT